MNLNEEETGREVYALPTPIRVNIGVNTIYLMRRMPETCRKRLITWREVYVTHAEGELLPTLITLPMMKKTKNTYRGQELPPANLSHTMKSTAMDVETVIHPWGVWWMMSWVKHSIKFPNRPSHIGLRKGNSLDDLPNLLLPCITVGLILLNISVTLIKRWLYTPKMKPWCARFSHQSGAYGYEVVWWFEGRFHRLF